MATASRYHPLLVALHWLLAVLILAALAVGFLALANMPNADPAKIAVLRWHMAGGMLILALDDRALRSSASRRRNRHRPIASRRSCSTASTSWSS